MAERARIGLDELYWQAQVAALLGFQRGDEAPALVEAVEQHLVHPGELAQRTPRNVASS